MGVELVEGADLFVRDDTVFMRTTAGPRRVDVIYRRVDDEFLDPEAFLPDSMLGVARADARLPRGARDAGQRPRRRHRGRQGDLSLRARHDPLLPLGGADPPNVPTFMCERPDDRDHVLANLDKLVVKLARGSGGYGMLVGPHATDEQRATFAERIRDQPRGLHRPAHPRPVHRARRFPRAGWRPRHVDLRPFILFGKEVRIVPGGLTRVALREGSLVVNSSQGGGTKDTWVLEEDPPPMSQSMGSQSMGSQSMGPGAMTQSLGGMTQTLGPGPHPPEAPLMLARTADSLFWLGRYMERAGNVARGLNASLRMASLAAPRGTETAEWTGLLPPPAPAAHYAELYGEPTPDGAARWLTLDTLNPSSVAPASRPPAATPAPSAPR